MEAGRRARSSAEGIGSGGSEMGEGGSSSAVALVERLRLLHRPNRAF